MTGSPPIPAAGPSRLDLVLKPDIVAPGNKIISLDAKNSTLDMNYAAVPTKFRLRCISIR